MTLATAVGASWLAVAIAAALVPTVGWLASTWRAHPSFSPRVRQRVSDRLVAPVAMPVLGVLAALFIAAMVSRVLLAIPTTASWVTALIVAATLLAVLWFISSRPRLRSSALVGIGAVAVLAMTAAGAIGARAGEREFHPEPPDHPVASLVAHNTQFSINRLEFPADTAVEVKFRNLDTGVYHNLAFYTSNEADKKPLYAGKPIPQGGIDYKARTPAAGTYAFVCDFHPTMTGTLVITEGEASHQHHAGEH
ncbi:MAG: cupredoxin domain-containing protein [Actinobacteria bacterium]|nr:cupredoxin domain-containing protein [Actinomycetota bacterium]